MSETGERGSIRQRIVDDYAGHKLYDERGEKIGKVEYTVLDAGGMPQYLAVKTGFFGSNTTLIPEGIARPGERDNEFAVQATEGQIKDAPTFGNEDEVNPDFEDRVLSHFGLGRSGESSGAGSAGAAAGSPSEARDRDRDERDRDDNRAFSESRDREGRDREGRDRDDDRDRESRGRESRGDYDDRERRGEERGFDDRDTRDRDTRDRDDRGAEPRDTRDAAAGGAAGVAGGGIARDTDRDDRGDRRDDRSSSGSRSEGGEREKVRVTVKRERARAERIRGEDGEEEIRIHKQMVEEEEMVEVEDRI